MRALNVPSAAQQPEASEVPVPAPTEGTVLIEVMAASLNAIDVALATRALRLAVGRMLVRPHDRGVDRHVPIHPTGRVGLSLNHAQQLVPR
ncbi:MAG: hypothetical protein QOD49_2041 [Actinomycetota bacterium]|jgi:NADPH:quinone reductase-like Zn-dependent oxidoreductase|nr:hypothetical protein [Actinomycetota bacterium]